MVFRTFPGGLEPLRLESAAVDEFVGFLEMAGADQTMFMRVVASDDAGGAVDSSPPRIRLRVDEGPAVRVVRAPDTVVVIDNDGESVASASWVQNEPGVYLVAVNLQRASGTAGEQRIWDVAIRNTTAEPCNFTWTVASTDGEARQPWIHLPAVVDFGTVPRAVLTTKTATVVNRARRHSR